jgi:hypothetical protein
MDNPTLALPASVHRSGDSHAKMTRAGGSLVMSLTAARVQEQRLANASQRTCRRVAPGHGDFGRTGASGDETNARGSDIQGCVKMSYLSNWTKGSSWTSEL